MRLDDLYKYISQPGSSPSPGPFFLHSPFALFISTFSPSSSPSTSPPTSTSPSASSSASLRNLF